MYILPSFALHQIWTILDWKKKQQQKTKIVTGMKPLSMISVQHSCQQLHGPQSTQRKERQKWQHKTKFTPCRYISQPKPKLTRMFSKSMLSLNPELLFLGKSPQWQSHTINILLTNQQILCSLLLFSKPRIFFFFHLICGTLLLH